MSNCTASARNEQVTSVSVPAWTTALVISSLTEQHGVVQDRSDPPAGEGLADEAPRLADGGAVGREGRGGLGGEGVGHGIGWASVSGTGGEVRRSSERVARHDYGASPPGHGVRLARLGRIARSDLPSDRASRTSQEATDG
jgi:hypothetical protein